MPFSQPFEYSLLMNPAFAGTANAIRITTINRRQWFGMNGSMSHVGISADMPLEFIHGGFGINILQQVEGKYFRRSRADLIYTWDASLTNNLSISAAIQVSWLSLKWDSDGVLLPGMIDPGTLRILPANEQISGGREGFPDFSTGMAGSWKNTYFGTAIHHLSRSQLITGRNSAVRMPLAWNLYGGINLSTGRRLLSQETALFSPTIFIDNNGYGISVSGGSYFILQPLYSGLWARTSIDDGQTDLIFLLGFVWNKLRVAFSYDIDFLYTSNLPRKGAYELSATLKFDAPAKRKRIKAIKCPKI